jgi:hypothetical protein
MYTYYFVSMHTDKIWWKKHLTKCQLLQFCCMLSQVCVRVCVYVCGCVFVYVYVCVCVCVPLTKYQFVQVCCMFVQR